MEKMKIIQLIVILLLVAALVILLSLIGDPFRVEGRGASTYWACVETTFIFVLPAAPIIYGYITKDKIGSILMGVLPFTGLSIITLYKGYFDFSGSVYYMRWLAEAIPFWLSLTVVPGLEGYFASKRKYLAAFCLYGLWLFIFFFFGFRGG